jgi:hypothetical protein
MIEALVARLRQTLGHVPAHLAPDPLADKNAGHGARDRLDVGGGTLFDPGMPAVHGRKSEVHHLMREFPVGVETIDSRAVAHGPRSVIVM